MTIISEVWKSAGVVAIWITRLWWNVIIVGWTEQRNKSLTVNSSRDGFCLLEHVLPSTVQFASRFYSLHPNMYQLSVEMAASSSLLELIVISSRMTVNNAVMKLLLRMLKWHGILWRHTEQDIVHFLSPFPTSTMKCRLQFQNRFSRNHVVANFICSFFFSLSFYKNNSRSPFLFQHLLFDWFICKTCKWWIREWESSTHKSQ